MSDPVADRWRTYRYPRFAHDITHPRRLHNAAVWMGLSPAPTATARVLELGCAAGDNIIPIAARSPHGTFVGVDLNPEAIALGQSWVEELGLSNLTLQAADVRDVPVQGEPFDYIIIHGLWSWVPDDVQQHVLKLLAGRLAPNGVAHLSFNAMPGWHVWGAFRTMLLERFGHLSDPMEQAEHALDYLKWLQESQQGRSDWWSSVIESQLARTHIGGLANLAHDQLSPMSRPQYNHEVAAQLAQHGLAWAGQVDLDDNYVEQHPEGTRQLIDGVMDLVERSILLDAVIGRTFSHSLVCRADTQPRLPQEALAEAWWSARLTVPDPLHADTDEPVTFKGDEGDEVVVRSRLIKEVLRALSLGQATQFPELIAHLVEHVGAEVIGDADIASIQASLFTWARMGLIRGDAEPEEPRVTSGGTPVVDPLVRSAAAGGHPIVGRRHNLIDVDEIDRFLLPLFDGTRDVYDAMRALESRLGEGPIGGVRQDIDLPAAGPERAALAASLVRARHRAWVEASLLLALD